MTRYWAPRNWPDTPFNWRIDAPEVNLEEETTDRSGLWLVLGFIGYSLLLVALTFWSAMRGAEDAIHDWDAPVCSQKEVPGLEGKSFIVLGQTYVYRVCSVPVSTGK